MLNFKVLYIVLLIQNVHSASKVDPIVDTNVGTIRGLTATDGDYAMYMGIPYAKVDEDNPFGPPVPYPPFDDLFDAFDDTAECTQIGTAGVAGTLDCLHLNIYVPNSASSSNRLPVLVWIYGGGFIIGSAGRRLYGPKYLVRHDVILVTVNYRVGVYGFMCLNIPEVPGNQGLKDQMSAMRWVNDNIEAFGGDVNKITMFGESAGGRSIELHLLSPQEKLFNNLILQSGTSLVRETIGEPDTLAPIKIAERLGFLTSNLYEALSFLSTADSQSVAIAASDLIFRPCVESDFENVERFITDYPVNSEIIPKARDLAILIGYNNNEQVARYAGREPSFFEDLNLFHNRLEGSFNFTNNELMEMEKIVRRFYLGDKEENSWYSMWELIDFDSDFTYNHPTERSINMYLKNDAQDVFYYVFSYTGGRNFYKDLYGVTVGGASHADELGYLFDMAHYGPANEDDQLIIDRITTMWTNFAKFSDPTPEITENLTTRWNPVTENLRYYIDIDSTMKLMKKPFNRRMAFWDLFYEINWKIQKGYLNQ